MPEEKKSILFTNLSALSRTGSELHLLQMAKAFVEKGWKVTCFVLAKGYPLLPQFENQGIQVIELGEEEKLASYYDIFFAQHNIVSDYVWKCLSITFDKVIVSSLGPQSEHEKPPSFSLEADLSIFVSEETKNAYLKELANPHLSCLVFPNYATKEYFSAPAKKITSLRKVAIISNHISEELNELKTCDDFECHYFGNEEVSIEITPEVLSKFDLVISIGRTAQLCFAVGIPYYCYDKFGGPGYILPDSWREHSAQNYSGRSNPQKYTSEELKRNIIEGFDDATQQIDFFRNLAHEEYCFETLFDSLFEKISSLPNKEHQKRDFSSTEKTQISMLVKREQVLISQSKLVGILFSLKDNQVKEITSFK